MNNFITLSYVTNRVTLTIESSTTAQKRATRVSTVTPP